MSKILVAYGTRHGSAREIANHIGKILMDEGHEVHVKKASKSVDVDPYDMVVVGSGIQVGNWTCSPGVTILAYKTADTADGAPTTALSDITLIDATQLALNGQPVMKAPATAQNTPTFHQTRLPGVVMAIYTADGLYSTEEA